VFGLLAVRTATQLMLSRFGSRRVVMVLAFSILLAALSLFSLTSIRRAL
jgi:hypothetical protein